MIPSAIVQLVQNYYFHNMSSKKAMEVPRVHVHSENDIEIEKTVNSAVFEKLIHLGYVIRKVDQSWAVLEGLVKRNHTASWEPVAESRYDGLGLVVNP
jgi:gamma-glutamyltranspeptidase